MIGGQVNDLEGEGKPPDAALLEDIHRAKTGALLRASLRMGAIFAGADASQYAGAVLLRRARGSGVSDCRRHARRRAVVRGARQDRGQGRAQQKITFPAVYGLEASRADGARRNAPRAHRGLRAFDERAVRLRELADLIVQRKAYDEDPRWTCFWWSAAWWNRAKRRRR